MRLIAARVQKYRAVRDSGWFDVENDKTILVGSNEAGKTALLQALQQLNPPKEARRFEALRDYPRSEYHDITTGKVDPADVVVVDSRFALEAADLTELPAGYDDAVYLFERRLDNSYRHGLAGGPAELKWTTELQKEFARMAAHIDVNQPEGALKPSEQFRTMTAGWPTGARVVEARGTKLREWLDSHLASVDESNEAEEARHTRLLATSGLPATRNAVLQKLKSRMPVFVLFNNYFRVKPSIHLRHLAERIRSGVLDDDEYDYGNQCLLKLLGFEAEELSALGEASDPRVANPDALKAYKDQLDERRYKLNAASVQLTEEILKVWNPREGRAEAERLKVQADQQYLKVVVEDSLGVEVELDQRSEGFQWLVSFFVVFFAEASGQHENAVLLLDEPGLSLHGLKQRDFRATLRGHVFISVGMMA